MKTTVSANVVGMKYYGFSPSEALRFMGVRPSLTREPHNSHDTNAIALTVSGSTVGHIDRQAAAILAPLLDSGATYEIEVGAVVGQSISTKVSIVRDVQSVSVPSVCGAGTIGIYAIWAADEPYVGQSKDVQNRLGQHWDELHRGIHQNPQLRDLWRELGPSKFSAKVLEVAPSITNSLELARWLHDRECQWIEAFGGLRKVINAEPPRPVLNDQAKRELQLARAAAGPDLLVMESKCRDLVQLHEKLCGTLDELRLAVSKAKRFWGIFTSDEAKVEAEAAQRRIPVLEAAARKAIDERITIQDRMIDIRCRLFM